jgi:RHS repeat-associated protein
MFHLPETGLYLTHYRLYDPDTKRWLNRDPIGEEGGINLYAYVEGNPINLVDFEGLAGQGNGGDGSASGKGTKNPYKHCREKDPPERKRIECKEKRTGKWIPVSRPESWPYPGDSKSEMCGTDCQFVIGGFLVCATAVVCIIQPELCLPAIRIARAAAASVAARSAAAAAIPVAIPVQ